MIEVILIGGISLGLLLFSISILIFHIQKCHYCGKPIYPWQKFIGYINMPLIGDGKPHQITAKWVTHEGVCTQKDIEAVKKDMNKDA